ncbi:PREDICTED: uncharacterized protein LOC105459073 isoform X2 [Wasmannia auropunctata]|uniref:uncharacterized protein LOC105459073 isoform X2 n=1 Tax=Wasmannia auropunctata TaxID=64793 RepID=UPI0005EE7B5B|nr:PREDICTED: uncharacterized protein LOC105459073 isoform X2 [Wasmannia auropunctata]
MRIQERCFLLGLCLLGGVAFSFTAANAETQITTTPGMQPFRTEWRNDTTELRNVYPTKEADIKATTEAKKKPVIDFKVKSEQKYQKPTVKDDEKRVDFDTSTISPTTTSIKVDQSSATMKSMNTASIMIPFLLHGVPIVAVTKTTLPSNLTVEDTNSTVGIQVTEETSSRGRALNVTASEPVNSLHANITDLSDISMDEDDKEVEGGEYIAPHNETAMNISSTLLPKASVCIHGNHTYLLGEKIIRDCEEKCVCSESGITDCQPLCVSPYVRSGKELKDHLCQEKLIAEEPCCALIVCPASDSGMSLHILRI